MKFPSISCPHTRHALYIACGGKRARRRHGKAVIEGFKLLREARKFVERVFVYDQPSYPDALASDLSVDAGSPMNDSSTIRLSRPLGEIQRQHSDKLSHHSMQNNDLIDLVVETLRDDATLPSGKSGIATPPVTRIDASTAQQLSTRSNPERVFAVVRAPHMHNTSLISAPTLLCDGVRDPGNLGTLCRSAGAAGFAVATTRGTVDLWDAQCVKAGKGAQFRLHMSGPLCQEALTQQLHGFDQVLVAKNFDSSTISAGHDHTGCPIVCYDEVKWGNRPLVVVGNESCGSTLPPPNQLHVDGAYITIPMADAESLNVAVAGSVLLLDYARRQRSG